MTRRSQQHISLAVRRGLVHFFNDATREKSLAAYIESLANSDWDDVSLALVENAILSAIYRL